MSARTCPNCSSPLETYTHEGVPLDRCAAGCGLWLDRGELREVVERELEDRTTAEERAALDAAARATVGAAVLADASRERRPCPVCGTAMAVIEYGNSGVPIDSCDPHGTWLDAGELERIEAYAEGFRRVPGTEGAGSASSVSGIPLPPELVASLGGAAAPPPPPSAD